MRRGCIDQASNAECLSTLVTLRYSSQTQLFGSVLDLPCHCIKDRAVLLWLADALFNARIAVKGTHELREAELRLAKEPCIRLVLTCSFVPTTAIQCIA